MFFSPFTSTCIGGATVALRGLAKVTSRLRPETQNVPNGTKMNVSVKLGLNFFIDVYMSCLDLNIHYFGKVNKRHDDII